jgi:hypothetical protein
VIARLSRRHVKSFAWSLLGFIVAPVVPGILVAMYAAGLGSPGLGKAYIWLSGFLGYPTALIFGVPLHVMLRRARWASITVYSLAGAGLGIVPFAFFFVPPAWDCAWGAGADSHACLVLPNLARLLPYSIVAGGVAGAAFWLVARPDSHPGSPGGWEKSP